MEDICDILVVGAGVMGCSVAYNIAKRNENSNKKLKLMWMEQYEMNHTNGSSHGDGRIMRSGYSSKMKARLAQLSYKLFKDLEDESKTKLMTDTEYLSLAQKGNKHLINEFENNQSIKGVQQILLDENNIEKYCPQFKLSSNEIALLQSNGAILYADKIVSTFCNLCAQYGLKLITNCTLHKIVSTDKNNETVVEYEINAKKSLLKVRKKVILCTGSYTNVILKNSSINTLPIYCTNEQVTYFKPLLISDEYRFKADKMPVFVAYFDIGFYGIPMVSNLGVKVDVLSSSNLGEVVNANMENRSLNLNENMLNQCKEFIKQHIIGLDVDGGDDENYNFVRCLCTRSSDNEWIVGQHNDHDNIFLCAAFCGEGFKFSAIVGKLIAEKILMQQDNKYDIHDVALSDEFFVTFDPKRFKKQNTNIISKI